MPSDLDATGPIEFAIDAALATDEIRDQLADARLGLTERELREHALANADRIRAVAEPERRRVNRASDAARAPVRRSEVWAPWPALRARNERNLVRQRQEIVIGATAAWQAKLRDEGVLPLLRTLINERRAPFEWASLAVRAAPGLELLRDRRFVVETESAKRFLDLAGQIRTGAIGIAGTRGAGKTTVIEYYQAQHRSLTLLVPAPVQYNAREFVLHLYAQLCHAVLRRLPAPDPAVPGRLWPVVRNAGIGVLATGIGALIVGPARLLRPGSWALAQQLIGGLFLLFGILELLMAVLGLGLLAWQRHWVRRAWRWVVDGPRGADAEPTLADTARERLRRIRFLQTTTTGWSGKVTVPAAEVEITGSVERAEQPLTYPEIVHELRQFIERVARRDGVIIAIDELDKIDDPERAQAFVNEIKGVFGVPGAQFLVSVSEDALASFERRGLPVRDAFDSAFDEIVRLEPLGLADTCALLRSRVIGVSDLFGGLAHCMAGGLARDLIRMARSMRTSTDNGIDAVCHTLIAGDIERKVHAFQLATGGLEGAPDTTEFIRALRTLTADVPTLLGAMPKLLPDPDDKADFRLVRRQARAYAYHCATVLEVFATGIDTDRFYRDLARLESLARAKLELGVYPQLALLMLDEFRKAWGLSVPTASAPVVVTGTPDGRPSR